MRDLHDEISTSTAARLIGVSDEMFRKVARAGHITVHRRGFTTATSAVSGYARFLKQDTARADAHADQSRQHIARASVIRATTARRRAGLIEAAEAELIVRTVAEAATSCLRGLDAAGHVSPATAQALAVAARNAAARIETEATRIVDGLRGGRGNG
ncbi:hypothetical protein [Gemmobacter serpentinus]|uniref:hypothetical protein n=1 Tax=Gemmobacter serpentinus TaxID=2652247 RepID=UPI00124CFF7F|nr:hypothetical protein [Gemmobacter serpentinus]